MHRDTRLALTLLAGFCDALTFVHMDGMFSAHVTGNFVIFAAVAVNGIAPQDYLKLATLLPFVAGVALGAAIFAVSKRAPAHALLAMALLFLLAFAITGTSLQTDIAATLCIVLAMGVQNSLHQFTPGPMTTVMTGTVTAATANLVSRGLGGTMLSSPVSTWSSFTGLIAFAGGCGAGAVCAVYAGFHSLVLPAILCGGLCLIERSRSQTARS